MISAKISTNSESLSKFGRGRRMDLAKPRGNTDYVFYSFLFFLRSLKDFKQSRSFVDVLYVHISMDQIYRE